MIKTLAQLQQRFVEISEDNSFPKNFGTGEILQGLPPNDIYQLGFAAAFFECNRAVNQYVIQADGNEETKHSFKCPDHGIFEASGYDNPVFLADTVANCPKCGEKCWNVRATTPAGVGQLESTQNALRNLYKAVQSLGRSTIR